MISPNINPLTWLRTTAHCHRTAGTYSMQPIRLTSVSGFMPMPGERLGQRLADLRRHAAGKWRQSYLWRQRLQRQCDQGRLQRKLRQRDHPWLDQHDESQGNRNQQPIDSGHAARSYTPTYLQSALATVAHQFVNGNCFAAPTVVGQNGPTLLPAVYGPAFFDSDLGVFKNFTIREGMKLQLRAQAYNFLNHPLYSFPRRQQPDSAVSQDPVSQTITQTNTNFGKATQKQGLASSSSERSSTSSFEGTTKNHG